MPRLSAAIHDLGDSVGVVGWDQLPAEGDPGDSVGIVEWDQLPAEGDPGDSCVIGPYE